MTETIAAVVVTFNRLTLLKECIEGLRNQTHKLDSIIVINNGSTDGTDIWLNEQLDLHVIHQENLGGAGGFARGINEAYERDFEWIWVMDDDGLPNLDCLEKLLIEKSNYKVIAPLVINTEHPKEVSFVNPLNLSDVISVQNKCRVIINWATFLNGILFNRYVIEKVGLPNKDLFIWGDEREYLHRILKNKIDHKRNSK